MNTLLLEFLKNILTEAKRSEASRQAAEKGLKLIPGSRGDYSPTGEKPATFQTVKGKLVPVKGGEPTGNVKDKAASTSQTTTNKPTADADFTDKDTTNKPKRDITVKPKRDITVKPKKDTTELSPQQAAQQQLGQQLSSMFLDMETDTDKLALLPASLKKKKTKTRPESVHRDKVSAIIYNWFAARNITDVTAISEYISRMQANGIDLIPMASSNSALDHGDFIKFASVESFAKSLKIEPTSPALRNLLPGYMRFFSPTLDKNTKIEDADTRKLHLEHFLGKNGKGARSYFKKIKIKARSIIHNESVIKRMFFANPRGKQLFHEILAKEFKIEGPPFASDEEEKLWKDSQPATVKTLYNTTKRGLEETLFPKQDDEEKVKTYERNELNGFLEGLTAFPKWKDRKSILNRVDAYRTQIQDELGKKRPFLDNLDKTFQQNIIQYQETFGSLVEQITSTDEPTPEFFASMRQAADDAMKLLFVIPDTKMNSDEKKLYTAALRKLFAKMAESHEYFSELVGGEEVYIPEYGGFPTGDKLRIERTPEHVKIERISVKSGDTEEKTGAQSEFGKYPFWKGIYADTKMGVMGWQYTQPFQLPRSYADDEQKFNTVLEDSGILNSNAITKENANEFRDLVMNLQKVATEQSNETSHLDDSGNKIRDDFLGDTRLRMYASPPTADEDPAIRSRRMLFEQIKNTLQNSMALSKDAIVTDENGNQYIDNDKHQGDSYLGYVIESLILSIGESPALDILKNRDMFVKKKAGSKLLDTTNTAGKINEAVLAKYFDLTNLKNFLGDDNYRECLRRGPMYAMTCIAVSGALATHNGFAEAVSHRHYILNTTDKNRDLRIKEYRGVPDIRDWFVKLDLFQTRNDRWGLSNHKGGFSAGVRITSKGKPEYNGTGKFRVAGSSE